MPADRIDHSHRFGRPQEAPQAEPDKDDPSISPDVILWLERQGYGGLSDAEVMAGIKDPQAAFRMLVAVASERETLEKLRTLVRNR